MRKSREGKGKGESCGRGERNQEERDEEMLSAYEERRREGKERKSKRV